MTRFLSIAAALAASATLLSPVASHAQAPAGYYVATPVTASGKATLITNGTVWKWHDTAYTAAKGPQRDAIACQMVAQSAGKLSAFAVAGQAFDDAALAKCNARAR